MATKTSAPEIEAVTVKYVGNKKFTKLTYKGVTYDMTTEKTFEMPKETAKSFLVEGNSKAFKILK